MKKTAWILVASLSLVGALAWWLPRSDWLSARLREPIESGLAKATGRSVKVGGVGAGLSGWVWLHDVSLGADPQARAWDLSFTAKALGLRLDRLALLRGRVDLGTLREVQIIGATLYALKGETFTAATKPGSTAVWAGLPIPALPLTLKDGEIWLQEPRSQAQRYLSNMGLQLNPGKAGDWKAKLTADPVGGGSAICWAVQEGKDTALSLRLKAQDLRLPPLLNRLAPGHGLSRGLLSGELNVAAEQGRAWRSWNMQGKGRLKELAWGLQGRPEILGNAEAIWKMDSGASLNIESVRGRLAGAPMLGACVFDLQHGSISGSAQVGNADMRALTLALGQESLALEGRADLALALAGPLSATALSGTLKSSAARWQGRELNALNMKIQALGQAGSLEGDLVWIGGRGNVRAAWAAGAVQEASIDAKALPAPWLQSWVAGPWEGTVDLIGSYRGPDQPWSLQMRSPRVHWKEQEIVSLVLNATGTRRSAKAKLEADWKGWQSLSALIEAGRDKTGLWTLNRARILQGNRPLAEVQGTWWPVAPAGHEQARFKAHLSSLPLEPLVSGQWKEISGSALGEGEAVLMADGWIGHLDLQSKNLQARGVSMPASAAMKFSPQGLSVTAFSLRGREISGSAEAPALSGPWNVKATLEQANLGALGVLWAGLPAGLSGTATGTVDWDGSHKLGRLDLQLRDPLPLWIAGAKVSLLASVDPDGQIELGRLLLNQGAGFLRASGRWDAANKKPWSGVADWKGLKVKGLEVAGHASLAGGAGAAGRLNLGPWSVSTTAVPDLELEWKPLAEGNEIHFKGQGLKGALSSQGKAWSGKVQWQGQDPGPWLAFWSPKPALTELRLDGEGQWESKLGWKLALRESQTEGLVLKGEGKDKDWKAEAQALDLARWGKAARALGVSWPELGGQAHASLTGDGTGTSLALDVPRLSLGGTNLGPAFGKGHASGSQVDVDELVLGTSDKGLQIKQGHWKGRAQSWTLEAQLGLKGLGLGPTSLALQGSLSVTAQDAHYRYAGFFKQLALGKREFKDLALEGSLGEGAWSLKESGKRSTFKVDGRWSKDLVEIRSLESRSGAGLGKLRGRVGPGKELSFEGSANAYPINDLSHAMDWVQDWTGLAYGTLNVTGTTDKALTTISVKVEDGSVEGLPFDLTTALVQADDRWVLLSPVQPIRMSRRNGAALEVGGRVPIAGDDGMVPEGLDVWAELKQGGLNLFNGYGPIRSGEGKLDLSLRFRGRRDDPQLSGRLKVSDAKLTPAWILTPLEKVEIFAQLEDGRIQLNKAQGQVVGGGPLLKVELDDPKRPALVLDHWSPSDFNLRIRSSRSGLPARSTPELRILDGTIHPDLRLVGTWEEPRLEGDILIDKGPADKAILVWPAQWGKPSVGGKGSFSDRLRYGVRLVARQDVMVRTEAAQVFVDTGQEGLKLEGAGDAMMVKGRIHARQGSVDYLLTSFQLAPEKETFVDFRGDAPPRLELWGVKRMRGVSVEGDSLPKDVEVRLHAYGELGEVQMRLESDDSQLRQEQLASLVGLGADASDPRNQGGFARLLGKLPAGILTRLARRSGLVDEVGVRLPAVENALTGPQATPGPGDYAKDPRAVPTPASGTGKSLVEVNVGKYVGEKVYLGVNGILAERVGEGGKTSVNPAVGGKVEVEIKDRTRLSAQHNVEPSGQSEQKLMLETSNRFENYNPRRRRWGDGLTPSPTPRPTP